MDPARQNDLLLRTDVLLESILRGENAYRDNDFPPAELVMARAHHHGVVPLLHQQVISNAGDGWSNELRTRIASDTHGAAACDMLIERELHRMLDALRDAGIDTLLLKGAYLAYSFYPEPALRPRGDTDLFIDDGDRESLTQVLESLGYQAVVAHGGGLVSHQAVYRASLAQDVIHDIDVHWRLFNLHSLANVLSFPDMRAKQIALPRLHPHAFGPGAVHGLLHACLHRAAHHGESDRLIWLWDIALLVRGLRDQDRDDMAALCERTGTIEICRAALLETNRVFPADEQKRVLDALPERDHPERRRTVPGADARHGDIARADLAALPGWSHRIRYVWQHAVPGPDYMLRRYGGRTRAALPWLYLRRWGSGLRKLFRPRYPDDRRQPDRSG